jgi:hypothetical protein
MLMPRRNQEGSLLSFGMTQHNKRRKNSFSRRIVTTVITAKAIWFALAAPNIRIEFKKYRNLKLMCNSWEQACCFASVEPDF